jgi:ABC-type glycerol-3-phosphate transport system substrate-binding protein
LALVAAAAFAGGSSDDSSDAVKEISWQVWVTPNLPLEHYRGVADDFEASRDDVKVSLIEANSSVVSSGDDVFKTRLASGDVPDLVWNINNVPEYADAGLLWPIPTDDPDLDRVLNVDSQAYKGVMYNFPGTVQIQGVMFYNKTQWAEAGLTDADLPETWAETERVCSTLQAAGLTPMITAGEWVTGYALSIFQNAHVFAENPNWHADRYDGNVSYTDTEWVESTEFFKGLVEAGCFNKGALSIGYADVEQQFLNGAATIYPMGSWFSAAEAAAVKDFEVGIFMMPTKTGKRHLLQSLTHGAWAIYADSESPELAFELVKFYRMDPRWGVEGIESDGLFSNLNPPMEYEMSQLQLDMAAFIPIATSTSGVQGQMAGAMGVAGIEQMYDNTGQGIFAGTVTDVSAELAKWDRFWDDVTTR